MRLQMTYDGPALDDHEMDVRDLAPALMAAADLFGAASRELFGPTPNLSVRVTGSFRSGSFGIDLSLGIAGLTQTIMAVLGGPAATAASNLKTLVDSVVGLIEFQKRRRGREILRVERREGGKVVVVVKEESEIETNESVVRLLVNQAVTESLTKTMAPLGQPGIDRVTLGSEDAMAAMVTTEEVSYFTPMENPEEMLTDEVHPMAVYVVSVAFREDNKWRVSDGQNTLYVAMEDKAFLEKIDHGESFAKGDLLIGKVRMRQSNAGNLLRTEYAIVEVQEHRHGPQQLDFLQNPADPKNNIPDPR